jgi:peptidoglycan/LPS O-acetylase OafA/YrhL
MEQRMTSGSREREARLPDNCSILLDFIRFGAAIVVALGHLTQGTFFLFRDRTTWAVTSVSVFFVLSGFVIRYVTTTREGVARVYTIDRISRIYSVCLPALLVTLVCDGLARWMNPGYYLANWGAGLHFPLLEVGANLTFTSQIWGMDFPLFSNNPFWSLSYECAYYVFYGVLFFGGRTKWWWALGLALLVGPPILYLLPLWLIGCLCYDVYQRARAWRGSVWVAGVLTVVAGAVSYRVKVSPWLPGFSSWNQNVVALSDLPGLGFLEVNRVGFLRASQHFYLTGIPATLLLLFLLLLATRLPQVTSKRFTALVRKVAEGTFTLYVIHFPIYVLIGAVVPYDRRSPGQFGAIFLLVVGLSIWLGNYLDGFKRWIRRWLGERWAAARLDPA